tara:strand:- start:3733 stop:4677 length:945 start_codon:yes stop_codon:yes gene_type:complete
MSLAKLRHFQDLINAGVDLSDVKQQLNDISQLLVSQQGSFRNPEHHQSIIQAIDEVSKLLGDIDERRLPELKQYISDGILEHEQVQLKRSEKLYQKFQTYSPGDIKQFLTESHSDELINYISGRINLHVSWDHSGAYFGLRHTEWLHDMVMFHPLYLMDHHPSFIEEATKPYNSTYQSRLRKYVIDKDKLPDNSIGFIFSWGLFDKMTLDIIEHHLETLYKAMSPGGVLLMNYNNCELRGSLELLGSLTRLYNNSQFMCEIAERVGFIILHKFDYETNISWIELKKPGILFSIKAGQALTQIKVVKNDQSHHGM